MEENDKQKNNRVFGIFFFRQLFSCCVVIMNFFIFGLYMGATTVLVPQLRKEANSTEAVTPEMASWLASTSACYSIPWTITLPMLAYRFGRRFCLILVSVNILIGNLLFYYVSSNIELIISQVLQGMLAGSLILITVMVLTEYTSPKYRGIMMTSKAATMYWGVWVSNAIGTFCHWKNIGILMFICGIYSFISSIFSYESPYWLASKRRFGECEKVHRWLKGSDKDSEEDLRTLILSQQGNFDNKTQLKKLIKGKQCIRIFNIMRRSTFYKPLVYSFLPICLCNFLGKIACTVYAVDIIKKITQSERLAYRDMLILDAVTVLSMYVGSALSKILTRRKQLLIFSFTGICFLYILSIYLYLIKFDIILENNYMSLCFLIGYSISIGCGPVIITFCCSAELTPLMNRSYFLCCISLLNNSCLTITLKMSPLVFKLWGTHGAFLFYAVTSSLFIIVLYKYLPETKDLTIQEIEIIVAQGILYNQKTVETETNSLKDADS